MKHLLAVTLLGTLGLTASCMGSSSDDIGSGGAPTASGGAPTASGGSGTGPGSGGSSGGNAPASGGGGQDVGAGGTAGAAGAPTCDCPADTHITLELPDGPRVYELAGGPDSCNVFPCEPPGVSVSLATWRHDRYAFHACHPDGDCIVISTDDPTFTATAGELLVLPEDPNDRLEEGVILEMTELPGDGYTVVELSFESLPNADVSFHGNGRACLVESQMVCAI